MSGNPVRASVCLGLVAISLASPLQAQRVGQIVVEAGVSVERYAGNFSAVTVPVVDSTERASAAIGEFAARGRIFLAERPRTALVVDFDGGLRQFAAAGFELRDYAPREWVGRTDLLLTQALGSWASFGANAGIKSRSVSDRPPLPLFLQPGYTTFSGGVRLQTSEVQGIRIDLGVSGEIADYKSLEVLRQLDLLDRRQVGSELGLQWGQRSQMRVYGRFRFTEYTRQGTFDPSDPFRKDRTGQVGLEWTSQGRVYLQLGVEGTVNRSNSNRPEYDAISARAILSTPLPHRFGLSIYSVITGKSYIHETDFARLVPGEEADNASVAYVEITRPLVRELDGAFRFGWTRAETDIGSSYYQRFGGTLLLRFRPGAG